MSGSKKDACLKYFKQLENKEQRKTGESFDAALTILRTEAQENGLDNEDFGLLVKIITANDLEAEVNTSTPSTEDSTSLPPNLSSCAQTTSSVEGKLHPIRSTKLVALIKCMIPRHQMPWAPVKIMLEWVISLIDTISVTVSYMTLQWVIGLVDHGLTDIKKVNIYYDVIFYLMTKYEKLQSPLARLIYMLSQPEDVTRRQVSRLLRLQQQISKPPKHITALLSLFKSYKPEQVPENVPSMNIESAWRAIPDPLRLGFLDAKERAHLRQTQSSQEGLQWNKVQGLKRGQQALVPPVDYVQIGSNIFQEEQKKSLFEIKTLDELGKHQANIELPCNAMSLLTNTAGHHLLTFANPDYQNRLSFNIYCTLQKAFIYEEGRYSRAQKEEFLNNIIDFTRYMCQGIPVVNRFIEEYISWNTRKFRDQFLTLIQRLDFSLFEEFQNRVLIHLQTIFYESSVDGKCKIISTLRKLITNVFVAQHFWDSDSDKSALFRGLQPTLNLEEFVPEFTRVVGHLIVAGLNAHPRNLSLIMETFTFYEQVVELEERSPIPIWTVAPEAVIYLGFLTKCTVMLSRVCGLLLRYHSMVKKLKRLGVRHLFKDKIEILDSCATDLALTLWPDKDVDKPSSGLLHTVPDKMATKLMMLPDDLKLDITRHNATMPYKAELLDAGVQIATLEEATEMACDYIPALGEFYKTMYN